MARLALVGAASTEADPQKPKRLLVLDDDAGFRAALCALLTRFDDLEVVAIAATGMEAVEAARRTRPDLLLVDVRMPGLDGLEAAAQIHAELGIASIVLTGGAPTEDRNRAQLAGAVAWLAKTHLDDLESTIRGALKATTSSSSLLQ